MNARPFDQYEAWELDMVAAGDWPEPVSEALRAYALKRDSIHFEQRLRQRLFRAPCPDPSILADWSAALLDEATAAETEAHLATCSACQRELAAWPTDLPSPTLLDRGRAGLRRLVMEWISGTGTLLPGAAPQRQMARGGYWSAHYAVNDYALSLIQRRDGQQLIFAGGLIGGEAGAEVTLRQGDVTVGHTQLDAAQTFTLPYPPSGHYELVITMGEEELVISDLYLQDEQP